MKLYVNIKELASKLYRAKYSSAYLEINLDRVSLTYTTVFCFRRLLIALLLVLNTRGL